ncbi:MAG TPA: TIGR04086 family membrane protein [Desulfobacteria bacterium]|nr:TIGR04086 family membrane protein [Desulfobacteria bacterium]
MPLSIKPILTGILYAIIVCLILSGLIGILTSLTDLPESGPIYTGIFAVGVFVGALIAARKGGSKGLYYGIAVALGVVIIILTVSAVMLPSPFNWLGLGIKTVFALIAGAIGGSVGVLVK